MLRTCRARLLFVLVAASRLDCAPGACRASDQCDDGEFCAGSFPVDGCGAQVFGCGAGAGECKQRLGEGQECWPGDRGCAAGLLCNDALDPPRCLPPSPIGGPCLRGPHCAGFEQEAGPFCLLTPEVRAGVCAPAGSAAEGDVCEVDRACASGLACDGYACVRAR